MDFKFIVSILEVLATFSAVSFGLYGALNDTKPKDGKVTSKGKIALYGLILSGVLSLTIKTIQAFKTRQELIKSELELKKSQLRIKEEQIFKENVNKKLQNSIKSLNNLGLKADLTIDKTSKGIEIQNKNLIKQNILLNYSQRAINPLFPCKLTYEFSVSHKGYDINPYYRKLKLYADSVTKELSKTTNILERIQVTSKAFVNDKISISYDDVEVSSLVILANSKLSPAFNSPEFSALSLYIDLFLISKDQYSDKELKLSILKGINFMVNYRPNFLLDDIIIVDFKKEKFSVRFTVSNPESFVNSDNRLISLKDLENGYIVLNDPNQTNLRMLDNRLHQAVSEKIVLFSGINYNQYSIIEMKNSIKLKNLIIHKIRPTELGLAQ